MKKPKILTVLPAFALAMSCTLTATGCASGQAAAVLLDDAANSFHSPLAASESKGPVDQFFDFLFGESSKDEDKSPQATSSKSASSTSASSAGATYDSEYFKVTLPKSWGNDWLVNISEDRREAMNASNYSYAFKLNGTDQFTLECKVFSLNSDASVGMGSRQVEFYPSKGISSQDETFIRSHIVVKGSSDASTASATVNTASTTYGPPSSPADEPTTDDWLFYRPIQNEDDAVNRIHDLLMRAGKDVGCKFDFAGMTDNGRYKVRGYEIVNDGGGMSHEATWYLYSIGEDVTVYDEVMLCDVDPRTMERIS